MRLSAAELSRAYRSKSVSPVDVLTCLKEHVGLHADAVNAFVTFDPDAVMAEARASEDRWFRAEPRGPLDGIPTTIKDLLRVAGWPTLRGSLSVDRQGPWDDDSPVAAHLRSSGALIVGKTTTSEFGALTITESRLSGVTRNPWDLTRTPGGSSGGAAVATALGFGPVHIATDGGGSIRLPSSLCGIVGFKPTFGRVPGFPSAHTLSLFHIGCMGRTAGDIVAMLNSISEPDARDWNHVPMAPLSRDGFADLRGLRIAFSPDLGYLKVDPEVTALVARAAETLSSLGATVDMVDPGFEDPAPDRQILMDAAVAALIDKIPPEKHALLDPELLISAKRGRETSGRDYVVALEAREALGRRMSLFHEQWDILATPTVPRTAGLTSEHTADGKPEIVPSQFAYPFNMTQQPAMSIPVGFTTEGMPVGMQLVGAKFNDDAVLRVAMCFENASPVRSIWTCEAT